jgi:hypothetical protein
MLEALYFIPLSEFKELDHTLNHLVNELWKELGGEQEGYIDSNKFLLFLGAINNIQLVLEDTQTLLADEMSRIHKKYELLYVHRKSNKPQMKYQREIDLGRFQPKICEKSNNMAELGRAKYSSRQPNYPGSGSKYEKSKVSYLPDTLIQHKKIKEEYFI